MRTLKTITGREIRVEPNYGDLTFIIETESAKYKTFPMSEDEFNSNLQNTGNDWQQFLKSDDYYNI